MELRVIESTKKRLIFDLIGADHTFCGSLKKELWNDKAIKVSAYSVEHPLIGIPRFIVETDDKDPQKALTDAVKRIEKKNEAFVESFKKIRL